MTPPADPYTVLEVSRTAPEPVIAAAYRVLSKAAHPDLAHGPADRKVREVRMRELNAARDLLLSPHARAAVDRRLAEEEQARLASFRRGAVEAELGRRSGGWEQSGTWPGSSWSSGRHAPSVHRERVTAIPERGRWATAYLASLMGRLLAGLIRVIGALGMDGCVGVAMIASLVFAPVLVGLGLAATTTLLVYGVSVAIAAASASVAISIILDLRTVARLIRARFAPDSM